MKAMQKIIRMLILFQVILLLISSCGDEDILAPNSATLTLVVNPTSIPADGNSTGNGRGHSAGHRRWGAQRFHDLLHYDTWHDYGRGDSRRRDRAGNFDLRE